MRFLHYWQLRMRCDRCGDYDVLVAVKPKRPPTDCHHCRRPGLTMMASCKGKSPWFAPFVSKPRKLSADWMMGGKRNNGKSSGRPKKKTEHYVPEEELSAHA